MDIEEIKQRLNGDIEVNGRRDDGRQAALLWIIEKLQETPSIQVAQLGPGDVVVFSVARMLSSAEKESLMTVGLVAFPNASVLVIDNGVELSIVGKEILEQFEKQARDTERRGGL